MLVMPLLDPPLELLTVPPVDALMLLVELLEIAELSAVALLTPPLLLMALVFEAAALLPPVVLTLPTLDALTLLIAPPLLTAVELLPATLLPPLTLILATDAELSEDVLDEAAVLLPALALLRAAVLLPADIDTLSAAILLLTDTAEDSADAFPGAAVVDEMDETLSDFEVLVAAAAAVETDDDDD